MEAKPPNSDHDGTWVCLSEEDDLEMNRAPKVTDDQTQTDAADLSTDGTDDNGPDPSNNPTDANIVWWDGEKDPDNPRNWSTKVKYTNGLLISASTFVTPLASSIFAPGVPELLRDFEETSAELAAFVVSVYVLGFAVGPMLLAPLSEMYGRLPIYHTCNLCFFAFTIACAEAPSMGALIAFRFLAGCFGAAPLTNGGGSIADMFDAEQRAGVMATFSIGPLIGPIVGPVIGGFLSDAKGWRWAFWLIAIISGVLMVVMLLAMRETYAPIILERRAERLRKETGNVQLRSKLDTGLSTKELFRRCIVRPMKLLLFSPICTIFAVYLMLVYGYLYLLFTSVTFVFQQNYHFSTSTVGLVYLGLGIGCFVGMALFSWDSGREFKKGESGGGQGTVKPEVRLKLLPAGAIVFPIGFFIYGWTADYETHWIAPILGLCLIGVGNLMIFMAVMVYLVDAFETYAASALAANTIMRSVAGAVLPLCGLKMYDSLGVGWGNTLLGLVALVLIPGAFMVQKYGERLRRRFVIRDL
ncbi:major facilitator superfamily domain-containing protein [Thelonectria olida]|uniref:Major facilitator superfamily domain-containing protein n=1 Tax=Thelonectria olida TaxID=1576542 RepID=A0A9P8VVG2_9HYPO|nr:major facilitator superfamily domain-containing protein [Thelonectria olida]